MQFLDRINAAVWGVPTVLLILGTGLYLSAGTGFAQFRMFPEALKAFFGGLVRKDHKEGISPFQTLCTALAATVGTGNIAGVAGAIALGGPGAVFWMWLSSFLGMIIKFAEASLAVRYHVVGENGANVGGTMYMIRNGLHPKWHFMASFYCVFGVVASFGVGNATQINAFMSGVKAACSYAGIPQTIYSDLLMGSVMAFLVCRLLSGGAARIGRIAEIFIPFVSCAYLLLGLGVLLVNIEKVPQAINGVIIGAFTPKAVTGGVVASGMVAMRTGISRGIFTNEAGMGTASMAYGSSGDDAPVRQGLMGIMEVFLDTTVICTLTALVILCSGTGVYYGIDEGATLTTRAFSSVYGDWVSIPMALFLSCFAFATILGWGLYGARCAEFLFGNGSWKWFCLLQGFVVFLSVFLKTGTIWVLAEILNGLMAIPNLITIILLSPELIRLVKNHKKTFGRTSADGGTYESFNQCKSLRTFSHEKVPSAGCGGRASRQEDLSSEHRSA